MHEFIVFLCNIIYLSCLSATPTHIHFACNDDDDADVAGAAAMLLEAEPSLSGAQVRDKLISMATSGALTGDIGAGSPNKLLFTGGIGEVAISDAAPTDRPDWKGRVSLFVDGAIALQRGWFHCRGKCS
jgi:hypothetical protein